MRTGFRIQRTEKTIVLTIRWNYVWRYYIASEMAASSNLLESKRQRILYFSSRLKLFFAVKEEVTVVLPFGCSLTAKSMTCENSNVLGLFVFNLAYDSHRPMARLRSICCAATNFLPFSTSDFEKNALKVSAPVPQVTKNTGSEELPLLDEI